MRRNMCWPRLLLSVTLVTLVVEVERWFGWLTARDGIDFSRRASMDGNALCDPSDPHQVARLTKGGIVLL